MRKKLLKPVWWFVLVSGCMFLVHADIEERPSELESIRILKEAASKFFDVKGNYSSGIASIEDFLVAIRRRFPDGLDVEDVVNRLLISAESFPASSDIELQIMRWIFDGSGRIMFSFCSTVEGDPVSLNFLFEFDSSWKVDEVYFPLWSSCEYVSVQVRDLIGLGVNEAIEKVGCPVVLGPKRYAALFFGFTDVDGDKTKEGVDLKSLVSSRFPVGMARSCVMELLGTQREHFTDGFDVSIGEFDSSGIEGIEVGFVSNDGIFQKQFGVSFVFDCENSLERLFFFNRTGGRTRQEIARLLPEIW